jgi:hypothetical protein
MQNKYGTKPVEKAVITETSESYKNLNNNDYNRQEIKDFIKNEEDNKSNNSNNSNKSVKSNKSTQSKYSVHSNKFGGSNIQNNVVLNTSDDEKANDNYSSTSATSIPSKHSAHLANSANSDNNLQKGGTKPIESTPILSRSEMRRKDLELDNILENVNTNENGTEKTKTHDSITSPIAIKKKNEDRILEDAQIRPKRKIQINRNNLNIVSDKFENFANMDSYYNKLMK